MFLVLLISLVNFVGDIMGHPTTVTDTSSENEVHTYNFPFVTRSEWHARKPKMTLPLHTPVPYVVIHHSYTPPACRSIEECENAMRVMQSMHMDGRGWWDIGYNFAVGSEGSAYEGRGWSTLGAHALHFNSVSIGICLIGDWRNELPPEDQLKTAKALIAAGVDLGYISPTYKLLGHRQVRDTECPGDALYKEIQGWAHYSPYPGSATDLLNLPEIPEKVKDVMRDTIGGFGGSRSTKRYLHLLVDHFTRYAYIVTSKTQSARDFIKLINNVPYCNEIGMVLTDQYPGINSKEFKDFLSGKSITLLFTAVNSPFSNGLNERLNQTLVNKIRCKINEKPNTTAWTTIAHNCVSKYNDTEHTVTGFAPRYLLDGTDVSFLPNELKSGKKTDDWVKDRKSAFERSILSHEYNKRVMDRDRKHFNFNKGDMVYVENGHKLNRKKLDELRIGPFKIEEKISQSIYKINTGHKKLESNLFHITKLIPIATQDDDVNCLSLT